MGWIQGIIVAAQAVTAVVNLAAAIFKYLSARGDAEKREDR